jgi:S-DNA-T family DNA segregation ATPase FtsK/SpoIIIE
MIQILLRVLVPGGPSRDIAVTYAPEHTVTDVARAVGIHVGATDRQASAVGLLCRRLEEQPGPQTPMDISGLLSGDIVEIGAREVLSGATRPASGSGRLSCDVVSGVGTGRTLDLHPGRFVIGRDAAADLVLPDPTVSGQHAVIIVSSAGAVTVEPAGAVTNPVIVDGSPVSAVVPVTDRTVIQLGGSALMIRKVAAARSSARDQLGNVPFNRTPYRTPSLIPVEVEGPGRPPSRPNRRNINLIALIVPIVGASIFAYITGRPEFLIFAVLGPVSALANIVSERRAGGRTFQQELELFERRRASWLERLDGALARERRLRDLAAPDVADLSRRAETRSPDLWPRTRFTQDFLHLRVGIGSAAAVTRTTLPEAGEGDTLTTDLREDLRERATLHSVPVVVDAGSRGVLALHGDPQVVSGSAASLLAQAASLHSPEDLVICGALVGAREHFDGMKWFPHSRSAGSPLAGEHVVYGAEEANELLRRLLSLTAHRTVESWPRILLLVEESLQLDGPTVSSLLESAPSAGITVIWLGRDFGLVPRQASLVLDCPDPNLGRRARLWTTDPAVDGHDVDPDICDLETLARIARSLAPVRDASGSSTTNAIPRVAPLLDVLGTGAGDGDRMTQRWSSAFGYSLRAPIGLGPTGPLDIDLVEHGPHALIAGTSGAGKSELLQSMIAALITRYPPTRLNLLFIDYKGGASSNLFKDAPHTVGHVTNLEADLAIRALVSLRAELDRRMRILEGRAKDLAEMLERHGDEAPPSLVIVVDEFATLVKEIPDFVAGIVDIAQRGRSLGIHLILATQRPAGAVNDNILANTNLRIGLRMLDVSDSSSILGSGEAASIPGPLRGRGFARLGTGGLVEFQSSYSGAPFTAEGGVAPVVVEDFPARGITTIDPEPKQGVRDQRTHLDVIIEAVRAATANLGLERGRRPWLEELPRLLPLREVLDGSFGPVGPILAGRDVVLGVVDEPRHQRQRPEVVNLEQSGGLLIFGTGGSGRSSTLRTLIASATADAGPESVVVYVLDFGGRSLEGLRGLPNVGAVASADDLEQTTRILMHLRQQIALRQEYLAHHRAENLSALNATAGERLERLLLVVDGYEAFDRTFERGELYMWSEMLVEIVLLGRSVGIHLLATADRRIGIPTAVQSAVSGRVILRTADADGLIDLGIPATVARTARLGDGRALLASGLTVQIALVGDDASNAGQTVALENWMRPAPDGRAATLAALPSDVTLGQVTALRPVETSPSTFVLGLADLTLEPVLCDVRTQHLAVVGPEESGRSSTLASAALQLAEAGGAVWAITSEDSPLLTTGLPNVVGHREARELLSHLATLGATAQQRVLIVDLVDALADELDGPLTEVVRSGDFRVLASFGRQSLSGYAGGWKAPFRAARRMLLLQPDDLGDLGMISPVRVRTRPGQVFPPGRGVFIENRTARVVQVARP